ncbi:hypothetical protein BN8_02428 [Fibrisoma limi BUZ 3]|uniref:Uncharacterized protein n=2 Tax=Fibrisoma limi TaxID=663275 RepID=I2GHG3_9BACT|nr:hypothetical protein BN8_02428 [Fibrisoma limi BUZ 3]
MYGGSRTARQYMLKERSSFETYFMSKPGAPFIQDLANKPLRF